MFKRQKMYYWHIVYSHRNNFSGELVQSDSTASSGSRNFDAHLSRLAIKKEHRLRDISGIVILNIIKLSKAEFLKAQRIVEE